MKSFWKQRYSLETGIVILCLMSQKEKEKKITAHNGEIFIAFTMGHTE